MRRTRRTRNAPPRQNFYGKADSRMRLFGFDSNAAFFKKSRADERNVLSVRLARSAKRQKTRAPLGTRLIQALLFSVVYHSQILIKKIANATHIAANITPYTTDRRNIVLFSPSEPG